MVAYTYYRYFSEVTAKYDSLESALNDAMYDIQHKLAYPKMITNGDITYNHEEIEEKWYIKYRKRIHKHRL